MFNKISNSSYFTLFLVIILVIGFLVPVDDDDTATSTRYSGSSSVMSTPHTYSTSPLDFSDMAVERVRQQEEMQSILNAATQDLSCPIPSASSVMPGTLTSSALKYPTLTDEERAIIAASRQLTLKEITSKVNSENETEPETGGMPEVTSTPDVDTPNADTPDADDPEM